MTEFAITLPIFFMAIYLALTQPRVGPIQVNAAIATLSGAGLMLFFLDGDSRQAVLESLLILIRPLITIISLMVISGIAHTAGLFQRMAETAAAAAGGNGRKLFFWLFLSGILMGSLLTNDAAVLTLTPLVCLMGRGMPAVYLVPFLFAVLNISNVVGAFVISNPINIVVAGYFDIEFVEYARWMFLPALSSAAATYAALRFVFRRELSEPLPKIRPATAYTDTQLALQRLCVVWILMMLGGLVAGSLFGIRIVYVTGISAITLMAVAGIRFGLKPVPILRAVAWDVLLAMVGFFLIVGGLREIGLSHHLGRAIAWMSGDRLVNLIFIVGTLAAIGSASMNNHPTAYLFAVTLGDTLDSATIEKVAAFAMLIGGDLGPKLLPIGSLAALLWFRILRDHGIRVSYATYTRIGIPVTLIALLIALGVLVIETRIAGY